MLAANIMTSVDENRRGRTILYLAAMARGALSFALVNFALTRFPQVRPEDRWLTGIASLCAIASVFAGAMLAARIGRKRVLIAESVVLAAFLIAYAATGGYWYLFAASCGGLVGLFGRHEWSMESTELAALSRGAKSPALVGPIGLQMLAPVLVLFSLSLVFFPIPMVPGGSELFRYLESNHAGFRWLAAVLTLPLVAAYAALPSSIEDRTQVEDEVQAKGVGEGLFGLYIVRTIAAAAALVLLQSLINREFVSVPRSEVERLVGPSHTVPAIALPLGLGLAAVAGTWISRRIGAGAFCAFATVAGCLAAGLHLVAPSTQVGDVWLFTGFALISAGTPPIRALVLDQLPAKMRDLASAMVTAVLLAASTTYFMSWVPRLSLPLETLFCIALVVLAASSAGVMGLTISNGVEPNPFAAESIEAGEGSTEH